MADAARHQGLGFGISNHRAENWWFFNGGTRYDSDVLDPEFADLYGPARSNRTQPDVAFLEDWLARLIEVVERFDPDIVYFDWWIEQPAFRPYLATFAAYLYNRGVETGRTPVINYKWDAFDRGTAVYDIERGTAQEIQDEFFQNDTSVSRIGWAHLSENEFKSASDVIGELLDVVSKNGSLLLNVGPRPDGSIGPEEVEVLEGVGDWLAVNGEAIFGTRPWKVFGEGPTRPIARSFSDSASVPWTDRDFRFTSRGAGVVYATMFVWPENTIQVATFGANLRTNTQAIHRVTLLGHGDVPWQLDDDALRVELRGVAHVAGSPSLKIELEEPTAVPRYEPDFPQ